MATRADRELRLDGVLDAQEDLYRIVQEALHNVVKHAGASEADIRFSGAADGGLSVEIVDNGSGAAELARRPSPEALAAGRRLGLVSMRERAERWGGRMTAGPLPGGGWSVRVTVPGGCGSRWDERGTDG